MKPEYVITSSRLQCNNAILKKMTKKEKGRSQGKTCKCYGCLVQFVANKTYDKYQTIPSYQSIVL